MARTTKDTKTQAPAPATHQELQAAGQQPPATTEKKPSASERFTKMVMQQYQSMGAHNFTNRERHHPQLLILHRPDVQLDRSGTPPQNANNRDHKYDNDFLTLGQISICPSSPWDLAHYARVLDMIGTTPCSPSPSRITRGT